LGADAVNGDFPEEISYLSVSHWGGGLAVFCCEMDGWLLWYPTHGAKRRAMDGAPDVGGTNKRQLQKQKQVLPSA
jgi:hypothetical protein